MILQLIHIDNYLIAVDDSEIKENRWYCNNKVLFLSDSKFDEGNNPNQNKNNKLVTHSTQPLEGVALLPPLEDDVEKLALVKYPKNENWRINSDNADKRPIWVDGYNKAKEKYSKETEVYKSAYEDLLNFVKEKFENKDCL